MIDTFIFIFAHLSAGVVLEEDGDDLVVALLQRDGERGEAVLGGEALVGAGGEELMMMIVYLVRTILDIFYKYVILLLTCRTTPSWSSCAAM